MLNLLDETDGLKAREGRGEMACREANSRGTEGLPAPRVPQPTHQGGRTQQMRSLEEEEDHVPEFGQQVGGHVEEERRLKKASFLPHFDTFDSPGWGVPRL